MLSVELMEERVLRRDFADAWRVVVWLRRSVIEVSRVASCSGVQESWGFWISVVRLDRSKGIIARTFNRLIR